jgi:aspartokinase-like uncharacterized kinase
MNSPLVIKLGGSLLGDPEDGRLRRWCDWLAGAGAGRSIVVAGGGPFADAVRASQKHWRFPDDIAHRMALRAMDQYALMLGESRPGLVATDEIARMTDLCVAGRTPVWMPARELDTRLDLPRDWRVTSDSLAAWLAHQLGLPRVLLVKSCDIPEAPLAELARRGIVDTWLPAFAAEHGIEVCLIQADGSLPV